MLGRLAVDNRHQGEGLAGAKLKHFVTKAIEASENVGVRLLLVHAKHDRAKAFYQHFGFAESPVDALTLMMLLPAKRRKGAASG